MILDWSKIKKLSIDEKIGNLDVVSQGEVKSVKDFPIFSLQGTEWILKPLSRTKPFVTPLFSCAECFWSTILHTYFDEATPIYELAYCEGLSASQPKYFEKGCLVPNVLSENQKMVNLLSYFRAYPDPRVDIDSYINYCGKIYDYVPILESSFFRENAWGEALAKEILLSILEENQNFHYENVSLIFEEDHPIRLTPPLDHEFSTKFLFVDTKESRKEYLTPYCFSDSESTLGKNLSLILRTYPEMCHAFLDSLEQLESSLSTLEIRLDSDFIGSISSSDFLVGRLRFHSHREDLASILEAQLENHRYSTDWTLFFQKTCQEIALYVHDYVSFLKRNLGKESTEGTKVLVNQKKISKE